jgi:DNA-binding winged helix-turn-helix (wHTH) protein/TolB-like protein
VTNRPGPAYDFGEFRLAASQRVLFRHGELVPLTPKAFDTLLTLVRRHGQVVDKDELMQAVWPDTFVEDNSLARNISVLRRLFEGGATGVARIETIPRRGYRFVAPVQERWTDEDQPVAADAIIERPPARTRGRALVTMAAVVLVVGIAAIWQLGFGTPPSPPASNTVHLAVLPFQVLPRADPAGAYLSLGIPDAIITRLAGIRSLRVRPTSAVVRYGAAGLDVHRAGRELGVQHVLSGTLHVASRGYRLNLQLVRVSDGLTIWGQAYDVEGGDRPVLRDDRIAERVATALSLELTVAEREHLQRPRSTSAAAYQLFVHGRALLVNYTEAAMHQAIERFEGALRLDPDFALARSSLSTALASFSVRYAYEHEAGHWAARAEQEARRALEQDASLADAHLALANAAGTVHRNFDWIRTLEETELALALDPNLDLAHTARARAFFHLGLFDLAEREASAASALTGESGVENMRVRLNAALYDGRFEEARQRATALAAHTDAPAVPLALGLARSYLGDAAGARQTLAGIRRGGRPDLRTLAALASLEASLGQRDRAGTLLRAVLDQPYRDHHIALSLAAAYAQLGDVPQGLQWLRQAAATGFPCYPWFTRDPLLEPLRSSAAYTSLLDELRPGFESARARYAQR